MSQTSMRRRLVAVGVAMTLATGGGVLAAANAMAATTALFTVTAVAPKKVAALTANQVVTLTGTGFDEASIASVDLGPCEDSVYIVQNATTLLVKTPDNTCGVATVGSTTPETITITDTNGDTAVFTGTASTGLFFVPAPDLAASTPAYTELSANLDAGDRVKKLKTTGGQQIHVTAGAGYAFPTAAGAVTATIGGTAVTALTVTGSAVGNYFTATAPAHAAGAVNMSITANGVTKTFSAGTVGLTYWAPPTVTTVAPASVKAIKTGESGGNVVITGTGFSTTLLSNTVTVCGEAATLSAATATSITFATPDPAFDAGYEGVCPVRVTVGGNTSPVTTTSFLTYLTQ